MIFKHQQHQQFNSYTQIQSKTIEKCLLEIYCKYRISFINDEHDIQSNVLSEKMCDLVIHATSCEFKFTVSDSSQ